MTQSKKVKWQPMHSLEVVEHAANHITISYTSSGVMPDEGDTRVTREFWAPSGGGYVRELSGGRCGYEGEQVCELLKHRGCTLEYAPGGKLDKIIRREYRRKQAALRSRGW